MKLLITLLTSNDVDTLLASVKSIEGQLETSLDYTLIIVVNTLNDSYPQTVFNAINGRYEVVRTPSNGSPGKGHNSVINLFYSRKEYDYLLPIDGDDFLYPYALNRLENYLNYKPDVLALPYHDILNKKYGNTSLSYPIKDKCYLHFTNCLKNMIDMWVKQKPSPFERVIYQCNTPFRLLLLSRKGLGLELEYSEDLKLFDDFHVALQIIEANKLSKEYNVFGLIDNDIYIYNQLKEGSATDKFFKETEERTKLHQREEILFKRKIYNKFLAIRNWKLSDITFLSCDQNPKFNLRKKIEFCETFVDNLDLEKCEISRENFSIFYNHGVTHNVQEFIDLYKVEK